MPPQSLSTRLSDVSDEVAKNFLSGGAGDQAGLQTLPPLTLGLRFRNPWELGSPHTPRPAAFKVPAAPAAPPSWDQEWGQQRQSPPRLSLCLTPTNSSSPAALSWESGSTVFQLPLPGRPPRLPQAWGEGQKTERKVPSTKAAGTADAEMEPLSILPALPLPPLALALRLLGAHSAPPRRPGAAFRTRCVWTAPPGAQPPSGRGRGRGGG